MSVSIRLAKFGKKHAPSYRVVVTKTRTKRNGAFIDMIGHYNPSDSTKEFTIDKKVYDEWVSKGAIVSDAVKKLVDGTYEYKKYEPKKVATEEAEDGGKEGSGTKKEEVVEDTKTPEKTVEDKVEDKKETAEEPEVKEETKEKTKKE